MTLPDFSAFSISELLSIHSGVLEELRDRSVVRSMNNPTGDYTEWLVSSKLGLVLEGNSSKGFDATDPQGRRYQIKGRKISPDNQSTQLGVIRNLAANDFDFLVAVVFDVTWQVVRAAKITHQAVAKIATFREHVNGHIMHLRPTVFEIPGVEDISSALRS
jgi:hypothetical protein